MQESGLNPNISNSLEDIKNLPDTHADQLTELQKGLNAQKQQILNNHAQQGQRLANELNQNSVYFKKDTQNQLQDFMNQQQEQQQTFANQQQIPLARTSFEKIAPTTSGIAYTGHGLMGAYDIASLMHGNVIPSAAHGLYGIVRSPLTQKALLQGYGVGRNIAPYLPTQAANLQQYMNQGGQQ